MKKLVLISVLTFSLVACGNETQAIDSPENSSETEMTQEEKTRAYEEEYMSGYIDDEEESVETVEASDSSTSDTPTIEETTKDLEESFTKLVQNSFGDHADVRFHEDSKTFFIMPVTDDLITHISSYAEYGTNTEEWDSMIQDLIERSELIKDSLGEGYSIKMPNPTDISRILIEIQDGELVSAI